MKICNWLACCVALWGGLAQAENISKNTARMQAMDKITGRVSMIDVPIGGMVKFGSFSIVVRDCQTRPAEETPDNFAFVDISDKTLEGDEFNVFKGWMISSSPATNAVEHPIYDAWLIKCIDTKIDKSLLLSESELAAHDALPKQNADGVVSGEDVSAGQINVMEYENENHGEETSDSQNMIFEMDEENVSSDVAENESDEILSEEKN